MDSGPIYFRVKTSLEPKQIRLRELSHRRFLGKKASWTQQEGAMKTGTMSLMELERIHEGLNWLFYRHQVAVLNQDRDEALKHLNEYEKLLQAHMREEEEYLIPLYQKRCGSIRGGAPVIFTGEHQRIREFMALFFRLITSWISADGHGQETLDLLDQEYRFKELMEHHDMREQRILLPELDKVTSEGEKSDILARFTRTPESLLPPPLPSGSNAVS